VGKPFQTQINLPALASIYDRSSLTVRIRNWPIALSLRKLKKRTFKCMRTKSVHAHSFKDSRLTAVTCFSKFLASQSTLRNKIWN